VAVELYSGATHEALVLTMPHGISKATTHEVEVVDGKEDLGVLRQ
jgi:hypothetical protein